MKHSKTLFLSLLVAACITACCSGKSGKSSADMDSTTTTSNIQKDTLPDFAYIADGQFIILNMEADSSWAAAAPEFISGETGGKYSAASEVQLDKVPAQYRSLVGQEVRVGTAMGNYYMTRITGLKLYFTVIPHFGTVMEWNDSSYSKQRMAVAICAEAPAYLVAEFEVKDNEALFAIPASRPAAAILQMSKLANAYEKEVGLQLYNSVKYKATQLSYDSVAEVKGKKWWKDESATVLWTSFKTKDTLKYLTVTHESGNPCGNEFYAAHFSIWKAEPKLTMIWMGEGSYTPIAGVDLDNDGVPEIIASKGFGETVVLKQVGNEWIETHDWKIAYHDCPC